MAGPQLQINIGANVAAAVAGLNGVGNAGNNAAAGLNNTGAAANNAGRGLNNLAPLTRPNLQGLTLLGQAGNNAAAGLGQTASAANTAGRALNNARNNVGGANAALTDLGRIVQDAPFGIVGITNNITQLSDSFGRLRQQTGSGRAALSALLGSLTGPGGIGIAISLVTTALTFASVGFGAWTRGLSGSKKETDKAKTAAEEYAKALQSIGNELTGEASRVSVLVEALKGETLTRKEKQAALKELKGINSEYFGQLKEEKGFIDSLKVAYDNYLSSLKKQFAAKALSKQLDTLFARRLELEIQLDPSLSAQTDKNISAALNRLQGELRQLGGVEILKNADLTNLTAAQKRVGELVRLIKNLESTRVVDFTAGLKQKELADTNKQIDGILRRVGLFGKTGLDLKLTADGKEKPDEELKKLKSELEGLQKQLQVTNELRSAGVLPINRENDALQLQLRILETLGKIDAREVVIGLKPALEIDPVLADLEIKKAQEEFARRASSGVRAIRIPFLVRFTFSDGSSNNPFSPAGAIPGSDKIADDAFDGVIKAIRAGSFKKQADIENALSDSLVKIVEQGAIDAFANVGDTIGAAFGAALSGGDFGAAISAGAQTLLNGIGGVLQEVGKQIIATSTLIKALKEALKSLFANPAAGIVVGIGLVALGGLLKNIKFPAFADGITSFAGGLALVGDRGPELVRLPAGSDVINNRQMQFGQQQRVVVEGVIRGRDIFLTNNRAAAANSRI